MDGYHSTAASADKKSRARVKEERRRKPEVQKVR
jgi:hypothetical protein